MKVTNCACDGLGDADLSWWQGLIKTGVDTTSGILSSRYGVPPPGSAVMRGPDGSYQFVRSGSGTLGAQFGTYGGPAFDTGTLMIAGVVLIGGVFLLKALK